MTKGDFARGNFDGVGSYPFVIDFQMMLRLVGDRDYAVAGMWLAWAHVSSEGDSADNDAERISTLAIVAKLQVAAAAD